MAHPTHDAAQPTVFVVDDDADHRQLVAKLVSTIDIPCRTFSSGEELLSDLDPTVAGCYLVDLRMRGMSGVAVQRELRAAGATAPFVLITGFASVPVAVETMKAGAFDFLEKPVPAQELLDVIQAAIAADTRRRHDLARIRAYRVRFARLTEREREVAIHMVDGDASKVIALDLGITEKTVEVHRSHILKKMNLSATVDFVRQAVEVDGLVQSTARPATNGSKRATGWVEPEPPPRGGVLVAPASNNGSGYGGSAALVAAPPRR